MAVMLDLLRSAVCGQFGATLDMLQAVIEKCPDDLWDDEGDGGPPVWRVAYHTLFYVDFYLANGKEAFEPAEFHEEWAHLFEEKVPFPPFEVTVPTTVYTKAQLLDYLGEIRGRLANVLKGMNEAWAARPSAFEWIPGTNVDLLLYNLRHAQHHVGQLSLLLRRRRGIRVEWARAQAPVANMA